MVEFDPQNHLGYVHLPHFVVPNKQSSEKYSERILLMEMNIINGGVILIRENVEPKQ